MTIHQTKGGGYTVIDGDKLYGVEIAKKIFRMKFLGTIDKKRYAPPGKLVSRPSKKLIYIIQAVKNKMQSNP